MIQRLATISNIGCYKQLVQGKGTEDAFSKLNVVFARNGTGKSTMCDILRSAALNDPEILAGRLKIGVSNLEQATVCIQTSNAQTVQFRNSSWSGPRLKLLVYDEQFVNNNVLVSGAITVNQQRGLLGLLLGEASIRLQQAVETASNRLEATTQTLRAAETALSRILPKYTTREQCEKVVIEPGWEQKLRSAESILIDKRKAKERSDDIRKHQAFSPLPFKMFSTDRFDILKITFDDVAKSALGYIDDHMNRHTNGATIDWIRKGVDIMKEDTCPFCGSPMAGSDILKAYSDYFTGTLNDNSAAIEAFAQDIEVAFSDTAQKNFEQIYQSNQDILDWWKDVAGASNLNLPELPISEIGETRSKLYKNLTGIIATKRRAPGIAVDIDEHTTELFTSIPFVI